jgi:transcriptional regulator with XRE-family HTH domain
MRIDEKIAALRRGKGVSQEELAAELGLSRQSVAKWDRGESLPVAISRYFGVTIDSLLKDDEGCRAALAAPRLPDERLVLFLCEAKRRTYAGKGQEVAPSRRGSHDLSYGEGNLEYYDSFLGGRNFSGEEALWVDHAPVWAMNYSGRVLDELFPPDFLKEALSRVSADMPFRGPSVFVENEYGYHCLVEGGFEWFQGREEILVRGGKVYECVFHGGKVI